MAVLRFTASGLVPTPRTVQIRVTRALPGRLEAGAPTPSRDLTDEEVADALHHFLVGLRGPRSRPCDAVVLSGDLLCHREGLTPILRQARRSMGLRRITLHLGSGQRAALRRSPLRALVDDVALVVHDEADLSDVAALTRAGFALTCVLRLDARTLPRLELLTSGLARLQASRVALTWPLAGEPPPHAARVCAALPAATRALDQAGIPWTVKGLPACVLPGLSAHASRTRNRWYVDADHQGDEALLFVPDLLRWGKLDTCRFCPADAQCDGAPRAWIDARLTGPLRPIQPG